MKPIELKNDFVSRESISVVIPVYNGEKTLPLLIDRLRSVMINLCQTFEVLLINDGSLDGSWEIIFDLCGRFPWLRGINLMRNYGQHNALLCGIRQAKYPLIITMDDDLQNPPEEIPKMLARLEQGYDVVYGTPQIQQHGLCRVLASTVTRMALQRFMGAENARQVSTFRVFRTKLRDAFQQYQGSFVSIDVLLTWGTARFSNVSVRHEPRMIGQSNYNFSHLLMHALNMITGFSILPLRVASILGFVCMVFGFCTLIYVLTIFFVYGSSVQGFPFLASIIIIFSGTQLLALGVIGEYLARIYFRSLDRPTYTCRNMTEQQTQKGDEND